MLEINTDRLSADVTSIRSEIRALYRAEEQLIAAAARINQMWEGSAKSAFLQQYARELAALEEAIDDLKELTDATDASCRGYERCERNVASVVASIRI